MQRGTLTGGSRIPGTPDSRLFRNKGDGTFVDVTDAAGVANAAGYGSGCTAGDYDHDGYEDLYVTNFGPSVLYHNEGSGRFKEVARASGIWDPDGKGLGVVWFDYNDDGNEDLYVANDATPNMLYRNDGNGRFTDVTLLAGVCCSEDGKPQSGMGVDAGDLDGDGWQDLFVTNLSNETNEFYRNLGGKGPFSVDTYPPGLGEVSLLMSGWGTDMFDYDNDGDLDIVVTNGHQIGR